ncbi:TonB-dependent receptor domain-containing protein [Flavobacterium sp. ZT3P35]|uniref:TonB-dependent receptor domain-containing protein n=2 Tax=unclassified Flavobacterium TaxID=196869 RepID=UPI003AAAEA32
MLKKSFFISYLFFSIAIVFGQTKKDTIALSAITLNSLTIKNTVQNTAAAVSVISIADSNNSDGIILTPVLNRIPGVTMQQGALNTNRITIRGIGSRAQFGTTKIKAYFDGIPLTTGDGETTLDDLDLASIEKIEIIKGPNSTSFGSGLGGVIQLFSKETLVKESFGKSTLTCGSFGLIQQRLSAGYRDAKTYLFSSYTDLETEGFRANSSYKRKTVNLHGRQKLSSKENLSFLGTFTRLKAFIPSSINETDLKNNPEKAASTWAAAEGFESYDKFLLGLGYEHRFSKKWSVQTNLFSNFKDAYEPRPFDILEDNTRSLGFRSNVNYKDTMYALPFELSMGMEVVTEKYEYTLYRNLYQSQPGQGSIQGNPFSAFKQNRNYSNFFIQMEFWLNQKLHVETGLALNTTSYTLVNVFAATQANKEPYTFGSVWSPRLGLSYKLDNDKNLYASVSKGFSVPTVAESLTPEGQRNTNLKPEMTWNDSIRTFDLIIRSKRLEITIVCQMVKKLCT